MDIKVNVSQTIEVTITHRELAYALLQYGLDTYMPKGFDDAGSDFRTNETVDKVYLEHVLISKSPYFAALIDTYNVMVYGTTLKTP